MSSSSREPILLPKLRIQFAEFPYPRCPAARGCSPRRPVAVSVRACPKVYSLSPWPSLVACVKRPSASPASPRNSPQISNMHREGVSVQQPRPTPHTLRRRINTRHRNLHRLPCRALVTAHLGPGSPTADHQSCGTRLLTGPRISLPSRRYSHQDQHCPRLHTCLRTCFKAAGTPPYHTV